MTKLLPVLCLLAAAPVYAQCGPAGTPVKMNGITVCAPRMNPTFTGNVSIGSSVPSGAPANSVAVAGQVYSTQPLKIGGNKAAYVAQGLCIVYHWGMPTFNGNEDGSIVSALNVWNPTGMDLDQWLNKAVEWGAKCVVLTTKWYDGFDLWPTKMHSGANKAPYSIAQTAWYAANGQPDIVGLFVAKARARNLNVGLYFNMNDKKWQVDTGTTPATATAAYTTWIEGQMQEVLAYNPDFLWIDGWSWTGWINNVSWNTINTFVKGLNPAVLLINNQRVHPATASDVETYEAPDEYGPIYGNTRPSDVWQTISSGTVKWFYDPTCTMRTAEAIASQFNSRIYNNYLFTLGVGPDQQGVIPACQIAAVESALATAAATASGYSVNYTASSIGKTATASSSYPGGYIPGLVTDGDFTPPTAGTLWNSNIGDYNPWVEIDMGSAVPIHTVQILNGPEPSPGRLRDITVTVCTTTPCAGANALFTSATLNPSNAWAAGSAVYASGVPELVVTGIATTGRYVRIARTGTGTDDANKYILQIAEIVVQ